MPLMAQRILTLILLLCSTSAFAGLFDAPGRSQFVPADQAFSFDFQQNQHDLNLSWQVKDGYYLYRKQISITPSQAEIAEVRLPAGVWHEDEFYGKSEIYRKRLNIPLIVNQAASGATLTVTYQGCADAGFCYPPETKTVPLSEVSASTAAKSTPSPVAAQTEETPQPAARLPFSALWAIDAVEQHGIVFIDEIDKICKRGESSGPDVSREGVQRDLLPLVEGCTVSTKHGMVKTDHILFIASGAFQVAKPSDLIPELQGRLPIRVELKALTTEDFERILTEPNASVTVQYKALMATEGVDIEFTESGIKRIAEAAWQVNETTENIGARRLHTVLERLMEDISYDASDLNGQSITIDAEYVSKHLDALVADEDLSRFIL